jgi:hypothetical protein
MPHSLPEQLALCAVVLLAMILLRRMSSHARTFLFAAVLITGAVSVLVRAANSAMIGMFQ